MVVNARLIKLSEVTERLSTSRSTIYRLIARGVLKPIRIGRSIRFSEQAVLEIISGQQLEGNDFDETN